MGTYINKSQGADFDKWKIAFGVRLLINDLSNKIIRNYGKYKENSKYFVSELMSKNQNLKEASTGMTVTIGQKKGNIQVGDKVFRISSKELSEKAKNSYINCENRKVALNCNVTIQKNQPIKMPVFTTNEMHTTGLYHGIHIEKTSNILPIEALKTPISVERVVKQISKTNNTPYYFENITVFLDDGL